MLAQPLPAAPADQGTPAASNVPGAASPSIHADRSITFTLKAPDAHSVQVAGGDGLGAGPFPMKKSADGIWSATLAPPVPGFHYYWFVLDGVQVNDAASETYFGYGKETSGIEVPEAGADYYALKDVPHGEVREHWYFSKTTGTWRRALVYTPSDYDKQPASRYPVLFLQHGSGENEAGWTRQGKAQIILDNLIAAGKARPMIVVMVRGYAERPGSLDAGPSAWLQSLNLHFSTFEDVVIRDLIPNIDASYRTLADREHRALAGLSMGGMQTLFIGLRHQDTFAYLGSFSGPIIPDTYSDHLDPHTAQLAPFDTKTSYGGYFADSAAFNKRMKLLWLGVGSEESEQFRRGIHGALTALQGSGVHVAFFESKGTAHEWQTWRRDLYEFAPRLFR